MTLPLPTDSPLLHVGRPEDLTLWRQPLSIPVRQNVVSVSVEACLHMNERFHIALLTPIAEPFAPVVGHLRNLMTDRILMIVDTPTAPLADFLALGMKADGEYTLSDNHYRLFSYNLTSYNHKRTWNNPRFWANPENWDTYRW